VEVASDVKPFVVENGDSNDMVVVTNDDDGGGGRWLSTVRGSDEREKRREGTWLMV